MSFRNNRKGVLGEIIITFIATIVIIIILVIFSLVSAVFKATNTNSDFEGVKINNPQAQSDVSNYMRYSFGNTVVLRSLITGVSGSGNTFFGIVNGWNEGNTPEVISYVSNLKDTGRIIQMEKGNLFFYCERECKKEKVAFVSGRVSDFYLSPYPVLVRVSFVGEEIFSCFGDLTYQYKYSADGEYSGWMVSANSGFLATPGVRSDWQKVTDVDNAYSLNENCNGLIGKLRTLDYLNGRKYLLQRGGIVG